MATQTNFLRRYVLKAGKMGRKGFEIGKTSEKEPHTLHISFSIEKSESETSNTAKVQVWNLSPSNLKVLDTKDCMIELQAGYKDHIALIFVGNVVTTTTFLDGTDRLTEIDVVDGRVALRDTYISVSYKRKTNCKTVFDYIAKEMGVAVVYSKGCKFKNLPKGFSYVGAAKNCLKKLCKTCGLSWSMQNEILHIRKPNEAISTRAYVISEETGLLDIPKRITLSEETSSGKKKDRVGYEIRYLMNGAIGVNDCIKLESNVVKGNFRIYKLTIDGDNLEGEWICTAQIIEVK